MHRKIFTILVIIVMLFITEFGDANDNQSDSQFVKIGLINSIKPESTISLYSSSGFDIGIWDKKFLKLYDIDNDKIVVKKIYSQDNINDLYCIRIKKSYSDFEKALKDYYSFREEKIDAYLVFNNNIEIWIGEYTDKDNAGIEKNKLSSLINYSLYVSKIDADMIFVSDKKGNHLLAFNNGRNIIFKSNNDDEKNLVKIEDNLYRDYVTFGIYENRLIAINYTTLKHYLYGVVPNEMSWDWPLESLKAQAVAARSYALLNLGKHENNGFDLCDGQHCQVYNGYNSEHYETNKAVDDTEGKVIKYNGEIINAMYHSTSGGHTEDSENIWQKEIPYLRGVEDEYSIDSPNSTWKIIMTKEEIKQKLCENGIDIGDIESIEPISYSENGRILEIIIEGSDGSCVLKKEEIRELFGYNVIKSTWFNVKSDSSAYVMSADTLEPIYISLNNISVVSSNNKQLANRSSFNRVNISNGFQKSTISIIPDTYIFEGKGWGHGVGMSQWGAKKMAEQGYSYEEILKHYYSGVKIE